MKLLNSIQESYIQQMQEQGGTIGSSENRHYLSFLNHKDTIEGCLFWRILTYSYFKKGVYDYMTIIKLFSNENRDIFKLTFYNYDLFKCDKKYNISTRCIYSEHFDEVSGTLTEEGYELLCEMIRDEINN